jgi:hypothetical protein
MRSIQVIELAVFIVAVLACGPDPRDPPGCPVGARRCAGDVIQICTTDARTRSAVWFDVVDCSESDEVCVVLGDGPRDPWPYCEDPTAETMRDEMPEQLE